MPHWSCLLCLDFSIDSIEPVTLTSVKHLFSILRSRLSHLEAVFVESLAHFETEAVVAAAAVAAAFAEADEKKGSLQDMSKLLIYIF